MRESRPSGSEGGVPRQRGIPTPIRIGTIRLMGVDGGRQSFGAAGLFSGIQ